MIPIYRYGETPEETLFARMDEVADVSAAVAEIVGRVAKEGDKALYDYARRFDHAELTSLEVSRGKPAPDIYLLSAETLGTAPEDCLVFEDVPMGILAAKAAGMQVCGVWDRYSADREDQIREMADFYIRDFDELFANEGEQA